MVGEAKENDVTERLRLWLYLAGVGRPLLQFGNAEGGQARG